MCLSSRGILEIDVCVSISYRPSTGTVKAFLQGCTSKQQSEVGSQLREFSALSGHPLLVPILLAQLKVCCIEEEEADLWNLLVDVETRSRQTGAPAINSASPYDDLMVGDRVANSIIQQERDDSKFQRITLDVVGIIQRTTYAESHAKALLLSIDEIRKSMEVVRDAAATFKTGHVEKVGEMLSEKLDLLEHKTRVTTGDIGFVEKRAQAQQSAVRLVINNRKHFDIS